MTRLSCVAAGALACAVGTAQAAPFDHDPTLRAFMPRFQSATEQFSPCSALASLPAHAAQGTQDTRGTQGA
jgi:hypothetical protein